jgi:hypothetical protein
MLFVASAMSMLIMIGRGQGGRRNGGRSALYASIIGTEWHLYLFAFSSFPFTVWEVSFLLSGL